VIDDFVRQLLETDWPMGSGESIRILEVDASSLEASPPELRLLVLIGGSGGSHGPTRWRLTLQFGQEEITALAELSYRHAMATVVVPANVMESWHTRQNPVVVGAEEVVSG
jgi:hypothetical protein